MQIKLSKAQWEAAGKKAGWLKEANAEKLGEIVMPCRNCKKPTHSIGTGLCPECFDKGER